MGQALPQLEQLQELKRKLEEEQQRVVQLHAVREQELGNRNDGGTT
jgi:hypothetical protein